MCGLFINGKRSITVELLIQCKVKVHLMFWRIAFKGIRDLMNGALF